MTPMLQRSARVLGMGLVLLLMAWGARVTFLEGFYLKWPDFHGDFTAAMFTEKYWLGRRGIPYGPFFVIESYYVTRWPQVFTPVFFALANIPLAIGAYIFSVKACRTGVSASLMCLAAWLCYWRMFYAFAVAANPEFLGLLREHLSDPVKKNLAGSLNKDYTSLGDKELEEHLGPLLAA